MAAAIGSVTVLGIVRFTRLATENDPSSQNFHRTGPETGIRRNHGQSVVFAFVLARVRPGLSGLCWSVPIPSPITAPSIRRALDDTLTRYLTWYPGPTPTPRLAWGDGRLSSSHGRENGKYSVINDAMEGRPETRDQRPEKFATAGKRRRGKEPM